MSDGRPEALDERILVLAPTARDAATSREILEVAGIHSSLCNTIEDVCREMGRGAGAAVITAEAVLSDRERRLAGWLKTQPPWSDFPLVVLTPPGAESPKILQALDAVGPMTLMKRPVQVSTLVSTIRSALRDRKRQYAVRDHLVERLRAAEILREERERYRVTLSSIGDAVIATDAEGRVSFMNGVCESLTGWAQPHACGRPLPEVFRIVNEHSREAAENPALRALREGGVVGLANHTVLIAKDGRERLIDDSAAPMRSEAGATVGAVLVFRDVTERRRAEEAQARLAAIVESSDDAIISKTLDGVILSWNAGAQRIFGYTADEAVGKPITLIIPPGRLDEEREILGRLRRGERVEHFETVRVAKGGGLIDISLSVSPVRDRDGRIVGASKVARDVTDRKRAEGELARVTEESERRKRLYETVLSSTPDFVYVFSLDHRVLYANDSLVAMWGVGDPVGKTFLEIGYEPWHAEMHCREIDQVRETKKPIRGEVAFEGTNGRRVYDYIFVPVFGADGEVEAVAGTTRDVTDRQAMEQELRDADRKKDEFIALLAHELRNPLAPIRNGLQVMRLAPGDAGAVAQARDMMDRQLSHMVRLIDDLLDVSRINRNKMELRRTRLSLADVISSAVETARPAVEEAGHQLTVSLPGAPVHLDADLTRLSQVFSNLLTNSTKYTPPGGRIWLSAERRGAEAVVSVRDTGIGIPPESLSSIFDMFSQVDRTMERSTGGLGIGLALVKGLVEMHGGTVKAESGGQGKGSTFTVTLPVLAYRSEHATEATDSGQVFAGSARRVLVVDDNRDGAESLALMLRLLGNEVRTANDGVAAVGLAESFRPGVILMDVGMPRMNGLDATRRIREQPWSKPIAIIALTGWGQDNDRERSRESGCDGHLVKPVNLADLEKLLAELLPRNGSR